MDVPRRGRLESIRIGYQTPWGAMDRNPFGRSLMTSAIFCVLLIAPLARAQAPVVGVLSIAPAEQGRQLYQRFFIPGLRKLGHNVGQSLLIEYRWGHGDISRYPRLAAELIERKPAVIVTACGPSLRAIRERSRTVPVIAFCAEWSNFFGEIASMSRPGGYTTGITLLSPESVGKRLEILKAILPQLSRLAVLYQTEDPIESHWRELERLQPIFKLTYQRLPLTRAEELGAAFAAITREHADAVLVFPANLMIGERVRIAELALEHRVPSLFEFAFHVEAGGLLSYSASASEWLGKTAPFYVDKILKGARVGELPVVEPTEFEFVLNMKTARTLGLTIPQSILARADRVIE